MPAREQVPAFDMETEDPDDALTLCVLATHPAVRLAAVTVNHGRPERTNSDWPSGPSSSRRARTLKVGAYTNVHRA
jgi:hypothetical protein